MDIKPYPNNAKKHPESQLKQIAESIREFGWQQPIVVDKEGTIIVGHGRWEAYKKFNLPEPPIQVADLTEEQAKAYRLADNKLNESDWDMKLVIEELKELSEPMIELTGFDKDLIIESNEKDDEIPDDAPTRAQLGDIWALGEHRVMCGDATSLEAVQRLMGPMKADMVLTDPPYNVNYEGGGKKKLKIKNDQMGDDSFLHFLTDSFVNMDAVLKPGAVFYIWHADSEGYNFRAAVKNAGWTIRQCLIWNKSSMVMGRQDYQWKHEPCLYGWKDGAAHLWNSDRTQTTILNFDKPNRNAEHPTMKPVDLLAYQITNNTKGQDIVLDTFLGSGSTLIAAQKLGRICYGLELDPKYVDVILKRWEDYTGQEAKKVLD